MLGPLWLLCVVVRVRGGTWFPNLDALVVVELTAVLLGSHLSRYTGESLPLKGGQRPNTRLILTLG